MKSNLGRSPFAKSIDDFFWERKELVLDHPTNQHNDDVADVCADENMSSLERMDWPSGNGAITWPRQLLPKCHLLQVQGKCPMP